MIIKFENFHLDEPQIGDYIYCDGKNAYPEEKEFISKNIGKLVGYDWSQEPLDDSVYLIEYENIPENIINDFFYTDLQDHDYEDCYPAQMEEIVAWAPTIEELKIKINAHKYNI